MNKENKKRLASLALAGVMAVNMAGCKKSEKSNNAGTSENETEIIATVMQNNEIQNQTEIETTVNQNVGATNDIKYYSAKNIYVVTATTLSGESVTYLATPYSTISTVYYLELKTGCAIERVSKTIELVKYLDVSEIKANYTESEMMELYSRIEGSNIHEPEYPVSRYVDCPIETLKEEEYKIAYLRLFVGKDNEGKDELYLVRNKNYPFIGSDIYDFFTGAYLEFYNYVTIFPLKWAPLCDYIPFAERKESYTVDELRVILDYARQVFHKERDFDPNISLYPRSLEQKYSEEQVLVLDTTKTTNFGETEDSKKVHILLLTYVSEDKTGFNYSELDTSNNAATLIVKENGYTLGYSEKENGIAYIVDSELDEDALLPLNEYLAKNGYEDNMKTQAFTSEELQNLSQNLQNVKVLTLSKKQD